MKKENIVKDKSYAFALRMVKAYKYLAQEHREFVLSKQALRSGTSIQFIKIAMNLSVC
jgi:four helix bundle protein